MSAPSLELDKKEGDNLSKEKKRKANDEKTKEGLVYFEIWGLFFILISLILISQLGLVGRSLNTLVKMIFGDWYWLILIFLFYYGVMMIIRHEFVTFSSIKIKGFFFISAGLLIYSHFPIYEALTARLKGSNIVTETYHLYLNYLDKGIDNGTYGGGILGAFLFWTSYALLGEVATKIIAIVLLVTGIAYLFEKTVYDFIDDIYFGTIKGYKKAKKVIGSTVTKMKEASQNLKSEAQEVTQETLPETSPFSEIKVTTEHINIDKTKTNKYVKPSLKSLNYFDNKDNLEKQKEITIQKARKLNEYLKNQFGNLEINEAFIGPTITTFIIEVENSLRSKKLLNHTKDLMTLLENERLRIYERYENQLKVYLELPHDYRYLVSLREVLEEDESNKDIPIGRNYCGKLYSINLPKMSNILVISSDINSKLLLLKTLINVIYYKFSPAEFQLVLCDSTKYDLRRYENFSHLYHQLVNDDVGMKALLIKLYTECERRLNIRTDSASEFTPILIIINDFVDFYSSQPEYLKYLNYLLSYGAKASIYLLYATTNLTDKVLTHQLLAQFSTIIAFYINNKEVSFKYLEDDVTKLLKDGDCIIYNRNDNTNIRVQVVNMTENDELF